MAEPMDVDNEGPSTSKRTLTRSISVPFQPPKDLTVGYIYSTEMTSHFDPRGHQEAPERITRIWQAIVNEKYNTKMQWLPIRPVTKAEALLVHSQNTWDLIEAFQYMSEQQVVDSEAYYDQLSLYVMAGTTRAARLSCGGVIEACVAVARGRLKKVFAICRPPGHHAEPDQSMGFCFFNNVAVAARVVQKLTPIKRILILDWDVHHGNGTQRAFNDDPSVLYISIHRYDGGTFYPCGEFGSMASCGEGAGLGFSVNIPWPEKGMGDADYIHAFQRIVMPIAMEFAPELVIISAGFDAADGDELGECKVSPTGYAHMTHMLSGLAGGHLVVALEGGYNVDATTNSALAVTKVILGEAPDPLPPMRASETATETIYLVAKEQSKHWKCIDTKGCEPREEVESISFSIPEILKAHREHYLYTNFQMMQVPLLSVLENPFTGQVMCTRDLFENKTLIVLAHEFGNLRLELESSATCDLNLERSYLIDFTKELMRWINSEGHALLDVNLFPKPFAAQNTKRSHKKTGRYDEGTALLIYLWDNFIHLSGAQNIIFIGHGPACQPVMELIDARCSFFSAIFTWLLLTRFPVVNSITKRVKAVIQVVGNGKVPVTPKKSDELRSWYGKCSYVLLPSNHYIFGPESNHSWKKHGMLCPVEESQPVKIIMRGLPGIQDFIKAQLAKRS
ncbi:histone deacetylase clr3 [Gymnopus androsaceus JB14]|uniref:histone deacetylase n=1 Tax=Gymnopus androsaceus JB14 TaxID=1447944 RepID=A0A6A4ILQ7_9AGAR|nr:histone deacetylase clr3 [Gymnopus androsaceus JB14]